MISFFPVWGGQEPLRPESPSKRGYEGRVSVGETYLPHICLTEDAPDVVDDCNHANGVLGRCVINSYTTCDIVQTPTLGELVILESIIAPRSNEGCSGDVRREARRSARGHVRAGISTVDLFARGRDS